MTRRTRFVLLGALALLFVLVPFVLLRDPTPRFLRRRARLLSSSAGPAETLPGYLVQPVRLVSSSGLTVELAIKRPTAGKARRPLIVLLGGYRTGRDAARLVADTRGTVVAALSYPYRGDPRLRGPAILLHLSAIRAAVLDTPPAVMLALDYLLAQPDVDPGRVELVGVSLGAPFVCIAGALDHRVSRVWSVHGAGAPFSLLELNLRTAIPFGPARRLAATLAYVIVDGPRLTPEKWVAAIAPRPFQMINAEDDERLPRAAVERLFKSARSPKEILWTPGRHVTGRPSEEIRQLAALVLDRMLERGSGESRPADRREPPLD